MRNKKEPGVSTLLIARLFAYMQKIISNFRFNKSSINAMQMNVMRRNEDATKYRCRFQKISVTHIKIASFEPANIL